MMNSTDTRETFLGSALTYVRGGLAVIPLRPCAKTPATRHGLSDASRDEDKVRGWWAGQPNRNVAVVPPPGVQVVDVEAAGLATVADLHLPHTVTARTGGGGFHYYYRTPEGVTPVNRTKALPGVDLKAGPGGYLVAPPSIHPDTGERYEWADLCGPGETKIADAPGWLVDLLTEGADRRDDVDANRDRRDTSELARTDVTGADTLPDVIHEGERNETLFRFGCRLRAFGASRDAILRTLIAANVERCSPPLDAREVEKIASSASKYSPGPVRIANKILRAAELTDGAIFLALLIAATGGAVTNSEVVALAGVTDRTVRNWRGELREADLLDVATDRPADRYTLIPVRIILDADLSRAEVRLFAWLTRIADADGNAQAGQEVLGERIGADRTSVHRYTKALEAAGLVTVNRALYANALGRRNETNRYRIADAETLDVLKLRRGGAETGATSLKNHLVRTQEEAVVVDVCSESPSHHETPGAEGGGTAVVVPSTTCDEVSPPAPAGELPGVRESRLQTERLEAEYRVLNYVIAETGSVPVREEWTLHDTVADVLQKVRWALGPRYPRDPGSIRGLEVAAGQLIAREEPAAVVEALIALFAEEGAP